jgi:hypothetical protein
LQLIIRFIAGGLIVSAFALIGDALKPKSFAGLFGAAPSVALATLTLTILSDGKAYAAIESRSMVAGSVAFILYAYVCMCLIAKWKWHAAAAAITALAIWLAAAFSGWALIAR